MSDTFKNIIVINKKTRESFWTDIWSDLNYTISYR